MVSSVLHFRSGRRLTAMGFLVDIFDPEVDGGEGRESGTDIM
jgi:hypothetical protein